ncbi:MAG: tetratricopeptide repeat protein [Deltaproteobacteria bacterium]
MKIENTAMKLSTSILLVLCFVFSFACSEPDNAGKKNLSEGTDNSIKFYLKRTEADPSSYLDYNRLAAAYMQKARETGDTLYYDKAYKSLERSLSISPKNYNGTVLMAMAHISKHEFDDALQYALKAVELEPENSYGYGILGDSYLDLGDLTKAEASYNRMLTLDPSLDSYSRLSNLRVVQGDTAGAIEAMNNAYEAGLKNVRTSRENLAWTQVMLGSIYFNQGNLSDAEKHYKKSLEIMPGYYLGLEHLAEINAVRGNYAEAEKLYKQVLEINPAPEFYIALAEVYKSQGKEKEAEKLESSALGIYEERVKEGDPGYLRALALYYADKGTNLDKALALAERDLNIRKDVHGYDTLAWVHYKRGEFKKAQYASKKSLATGTRDAQLFYHAGMISIANGDYGKAREYLNLALETNPHFNSEEVSKELKSLNTL